MHRERLELEDGIQQLDLGISHVHEFLQVTVWWWVGRWKVRDRAVTFWDWSDWEVLLGFVVRRILLLWDAYVRWVLVSLIIGLCQTWARAGFYCRICLLAPPVSWFLDLWKLHQSTNFVSWNWEWTVYERKLELIPTCNKNMDAILRQCGKDFLYKFCAFCND